MGGNSDIREQNEELELGLTEAQIRAERGGVAGLTGWQWLFVSVEYGEDVQGSRLCAIYIISTGTTRLMDEQTERMLLEYSHRTALQSHRGRIA